PNNEDCTQRKRIRVGSHPDDDSDTKINNENTNKPINELLSSAATNVENHETTEHKKTTSSIGLKKRRKLNVDIEEMISQDEKTNDSIQSTKSSASKDESTATDEDDDDNETKHDDDDEDEADDINEQNNLPPTINRYLRLRQRQLGIFHRPRERTTCRAFHNHMIADRNLIQRMKVSHTLDGHNGCVNALAFNRTGTLLASASDDLQIILWDWASNQAAVA
ncbi:unnamed protein product, partial [Rotaria magnacalcarata]